MSDPGSWFRERGLGWYDLLYPGLGIKRFLAIFAVGLGLIVVGLAIAIDVELLGALERNARMLLYAMTGERLPRPLPGMAAILLGGAIAALGLRGIARRLTDAMEPDPGSLARRFIVRRRLALGPRVVAIGGGTGLSTLLRGLKGYTSNITAVVTVADDGGSSGRLRGELDMLPPGDIRNCLVALADTEPQMERLFQHRFGRGSLGGHSLGNLILAGLAEQYGDFDQAVRAASRVLAVRGQVVPSTLEPVTLIADTEAGRIHGESRIGSSGTRIRRVFLNPKSPAPTEGILKAIRDADLIVVGPGSLYTSIMPNLLVRQVPEAIRRARALRVYVCNVMTQPGETESYSAADHLRAIYDHVGGNLLDVALINARVPTPGQAAEYLAEGATPVARDLEEVRRLRVDPVSRDLLVVGGDLLRHDPGTLAGALMELLWNRGGLRQKLRLADNFLFGMRG